MIDPALEQALSDARRRAEWLRTGRVTLELLQWIADNMSECDFIHGIVLTWPLG